MNNNHQSQQTANVPGQQNRTLHDYLRILYRYRWLVVISFVVVLTGTVYYTFTTQPIYEAGTTIMIQNENENMENLFGIPSVTGQKTLNNQIEYLKSRTLAENVIRSLENSRYADSLYVLETAGRQAVGVLGKIKQLPSALLGWIAGKRAEDNIPETYQERVWRLAMQLRERVQVEPVGETDVIRIKYTAPSRREAVLVTNIIAEEYYKQNLNIARGEVSEVKQFLQDQLQTVNDNLFQAEVALKDYEQQTNAIALDRSTEQLVEQLSEFESQYNNTVAERHATETRLEYLKSRLTAQEQQTIEEMTSTSTPYVTALRDSLAARQVKLTVMQTDPDIPLDHPGLQRIRQRISDLQEQLRAETKRIIGQGTQAANPLEYRQELIAGILKLDAEKVSQESREKVLEQMVRQLNTQLGTLPEKTLQLARLTRNQQVNEKLFMLLKTKYEEIRITEAGQIGNVRIVDPAVPPRDPVKPNKKMNLLLGLLLGAGLGIGLALMLDYIDNSVKTEEDIEQSGFRVLGTVPVIEKEKLAEMTGFHQTRNPATLIENQLVTHFDPRSPVSEAYRALRTSIQFSHPDHVPASLLITSAGPGEGKSTTAANLAITLAQMGNKTLLVDADLRRPIQHSIFHISRSPGLTEAIIKEDTQVGITTEINQLYLLPSGELPPNPSEILGSDQMKGLLARLKAQYDKIIFDSPPVIAVTDAVLLSTLIDGTLLVSFSGKTERKALERAAQQIREVGGSLFGIVLNHLDLKNTYGHHYYNYHYYHGTNDGAPGKRKQQNTARRGE